MKNIYILTFILTILIVFSRSFASENDITNSDNSWIYDYTALISQKNGFVTFTTLKDASGNLIEKVTMNIKNKSMVNESFEYVRKLPIGNIVVDSINPYTRKAYHEFSPYLSMNNGLVQNFNLSNFRKDTQNFAYLNDGAWVFHGKYEGIEIMTFNGKTTEAQKFSFYGNRPTDMQHCIEGQEGKISAEVWYIKGIDRYVKQVVNTYHCAIGGQGFHFDEETYLLSSIKNDSNFQAIKSNERISEPTK